MHLVSDVVIYLFQIGYPFSSIPEFGDDRHYVHFYTKLVAFPMHLYFCRYVCSLAGLHGPYTSGDCTFFSVCSLAGLHGLCTSGDCSFVIMCVFLQGSMAHVPQETVLLSVCVFVCSAAWPTCLRRLYFCWYACLLLGQHGPCASGDCTFVGMCVRLQVSMAYVPQETVLLLVCVFACRAAWPMYLRKLYFCRHVCLLAG